MTGTKDKDIHKSHNKAIRTGKRTLPRRKMRGKTKVLRQEDKWVGHGS